MFETNFIEMNDKFRVFHIFLSTSMVKNTSKVSVLLCLKLNIAQTDYSTVQSFWSRSSILLRVLLKELRQAGLQNRFS